MAMGLLDGMAMHGRKTPVAPLSRKVSQERKPWNRSQLRIVGAEGLKKRCPGYPEVIPEQAGSLGPLGR